LLFLGWLMWRSLHLLVTSWGWRHQSLRPLRLLQILLAIILTMYIYSHALGVGAWDTQPRAMRPKPGRHKLQCRKKSRCFLFSLHDMGERKVERTTPGRGGRWYNGNNTSQPTTQASNTRTMHTPCHPQ
jgi:hypothetical protein